MGASDRRSQVLAALEESVCTDSAVEFAVAFGSRIEGNPVSTSDFDLAVKFEDDISSQERFRKLCFLSGDLQQDDAPCIDLSDIEALPVDVAHDAVSGEFVCGDEQAFQQCKTEIEEAFAEQRDTLRRRQRAVIDRIAEGGLRG